MKTIELEKLVAFTVLTFCENLAELGCPRNTEPDMWFRNLSDKRKEEVGSKMLDIISREMYISPDTSISVKRAPKPKKDSGWQHYNHKTRHIGKKLYCSDCKCFVGEK